VGKLASICRRVRWEYQGGRGRSPYAGHSGENDGRMRPQSAKGDLVDFKELLRRGGVASGWFPDALRASRLPYAKQRGLRTAAAGLARYG